jgi:hypothetical protein
MHQEPRSGGRACASVSNNLLGSIGILREIHSPALVPNAVLIGFGHALSDCPIKPLDVNLLDFGVRPINETIIDDALEKVPGLRTVQTNAEISEIADARRVVGVFGISKRDCELNTHCRPHVELPGLRWVD